MLMSLGLFVFSIDRLAFQELQRKTSWRWAANPRVGAAPARQFLGPGEDNVTLSGQLALDLGMNPATLDQVREMAAQGEAWQLIDGAGKVYGDFVVTGVAETQSMHFGDGTPRRVSFTLELESAGEAAAVRA